MNIIYKISDPITGKKYIGSKCDWKGMGTYYGSSKDFEMTKIIKERKKDLVFEVLEIVVHKSEICEKELWWQKLNRVVEDPTFWNKRYAGKWSSYSLCRVLTEEEKNVRRENVEAHKKTSAAIKKIWVETKQDGKSYFSEDGMRKLVESGKRVGTLEKTEKWREKHSIRRKGEKNSHESKKKTSESLLKLYADGIIKNGMSTRIIAIPILGGTPISYNSKTEAAKSVNKQRYQINKVIDTDQEFCGYLWKTL